mmetsp:Transcript_155598/g.290386  ORF Transcript_155598/g.290386 Transcript_155598/m.290386 type:complete len:240 (+) Transcript_155598:102-821(+)
MGPPLAGWRVATATARHGDVCSQEMLTQLGSCRKAPKWSFAPRPRVSARETTAQAGGADDVNRDGFSKYKRDPKWSMGKPPMLRPKSAPPGPNYKPPERPTTPQYSFGSRRPRGMTSEPPTSTDGPGPGGYVPKFGGGPKHSMPGKPRRPTSAGPGPGAYRPKLPDGPKYAYHWGNGDPGRRQSSDGPGPQGEHGRPDRGLKYSFGYRRETPSHGGRNLGLPFTQFGYDDFGHSQCPCY